MAERRISVFFYGLFMDVELLRSKGAEPHTHKTAMVAGFALRIGQRATLVPHVNACSYGILMQLTHREIESLYAEAGLNTYRPEGVLAQLADGSLAPCLCYNLSDDVAVGSPNAEYAAKLRSLAGRLAFPAAYVESIR